MQPRQTIEERFYRFHQANPHVWAELWQLAQEYKASGARRIGVKALWEQLRERLRVKYPDGGYKLNNDFTGSFARALVQADPQLADLIELRQRRSA